jgi:hypothetical protein
MLRLEEGSAVLNRMHALWEDIRIDEGLLTLDDTRVVFEEPQAEIELLSTLPALYRWLQTLGCHVSYEFLTENKA